MENPTDHQDSIGESTPFLDALDKVSRVAKLRRPVLIIGERGTGKELFASRLHYLSPWWSSPYVKVNCGALVETLLESELFGHEAGSFTGAQRRRLGRFEQAESGTLFLDEISNTSLRLQEKILRVVEYGEFERVGGERALKSKARLVAATNMDLPELADRGGFRHDLLDRLSFDVVTIPPLRARGGDILVLARHFAMRFASETGMGFFPGFTDEALQELLAYRWPGNVRELKNVVERSIYRSEDPEAPIQELVWDPFASPYRPKQSAFPGQISGQAGDQGSNAGSGSPGLTSPGLTSCADPKSSPDPEEQPLDAIRDFSGAVATYEKELLGAALKSERFHQKNTAKRLGLTYNQLRGLLRKYPELAP